MKIDMNDVLEIKKALEFYATEQHWLFVEAKDINKYRSKGYVISDGSGVMKTEIIERGQVAQNALTIIENYL